MLVHSSLIEVSWVLLEALGSSLSFKAFAARRVWLGVYGSSASGACVV